MAIRVTVALVALFSAFFVLGGSPRGLLNGVAVLLRDTMGLGCSTSY